METSKLNFVPCVGWVRKGVAKEVPERCQFTTEQIRSKIQNDQQKLQELTSDQDAMETEEPAGNAEQGDDNNDDGDDQKIIERYGLDNYDDSDEDEDDFLVADDTDTDRFLNREQVYSDDEEEKDDFRVKPTDNLVLVGHVEEDSVSLEIRVYNEQETYVHHEIYLSAYPLCFQWLDFKTNTEKGNLVAVGDMEKDIQIWDLDLVDTLDPFLTLVGHRKSVLDLSWNPATPNRLASGSADHKCFIWDLQERKCVQKFDMFKCNVQSVDFHPFETSILLCGDSNGNAKLVNCQTGSVKNWNVSRTEIEKVGWNPAQPYIFFCGDSNGTIYSVDCRNERDNLATVNAHDGMISGMEFSCSYQNCLVTGSADEMVKVWQINPATYKPELVEELNPQVGTILSLAANPDLPNIFAVAGNNVAKNFMILDICQYPKVKQQFQV